MLIREKEPARVERAAEIPRAAVAISRIEGEAAARDSEVAKQLRMNLPRQNEAKMMQARAAALQMMNRDGFFSIICTASAIAMTSLAPGDNAEACRESNAFVPATTTRQRDG